MLRDKEEEEEGEGNTKFQKVRKRNGLFSYRII